MKDLSISPASLLMSNHVEEGPTAIYAELIARNVIGIHRTVVADIRTILSQLQSDSNMTLYQKERLASMQGNSHIILEGNHKAVAYGILSKEIPCTMLEDDDDVSTCIELSSQGKMIRFVHRQTELQSMVKEALGLPWMQSEQNNVAAYIESAIEDQLFSIEQWPKYLKEIIRESHAS